MITVNGRVRMAEGGALVLVAGEQLIDVGGAEQTVLHDQGGQVVIDAAHAASLEVDDPGPLAIELVRGLVSGLAGQEHVARGKVAVDEASFAAGSLVHFDRFEGLD